MSKRSSWKTWAWKRAIKREGRWRDRFRRCLLCGTPSPVRYFYGSSSFSGHLYMCFPPAERLVCGHRRAEHEAEIGRLLDAKAERRRKAWLGRKGEL